MIHKKWSPAIDSRRQAPIPVTPTRGWIPPSPMFFFPFVEHSFLHQYKVPVVYRIRRVPCANMPQQSLRPPNRSGFTYLQSMDFQREPQSKHHLYCEQEKPARCHGSLLLRLGTQHIQNRTRDAHKISPHGTMTKRTPAMNWDHAVSWGGGLG